MVHLYVDGVTMEGMTDGIKLSLSVLRTVYLFVKVSWQGPEKAEFHVEYGIGFVLLLKRLS